MNRLPEQRRLGCPRRLWHFADGDLWTKVVPIADVLKRMLDGKTELATQNVRAKNDQFWPERDTETASALKHVLEYLVRASPRLRGPVAGTLRIDLEIGDRNEPPASWLSDRDLAFDGRTTPSVLDADPKDKESGLAFGM